MGCPSCLLLCCLLVIGHVQESLQLKIKQVNIPETVKEGSVDYVILDCDYDLEKTSTQLLVVKWFFKEDSPTKDFYVAYQWIHGRPPEAEPSFSQYIDTTYKASDDPFTMYRAMKLNKPTVDISGTYKCEISTVADETQATGSMVVYSTEKRFELITRRTVTNEEKEGVEVTCVAEGVYPLPTLEFFVNEDYQESSIKPDVTMRAGLYNILSRMDIEDENLPELAIFKCTLSIPKANYNVSRESVYLPGSSTTTTTATTKLLRKMEIQALDKSEPDFGYGGASTACTRSLSLALLILLVATTFL